MIRWSYCSAVMFIFNCGQSSVVGYFILIMFLFRVWFLGAACWLRVFLLLIRHWCVKVQVFEAVDVDGHLTALVLVESQERRVLLLFCLAWPFWFGHFAVIVVQEDILSDIVAEADSLLRGILLAVDIITCIQLNQLQASSIILKILSSLSTLLMHRSSLCLGNNPAGMNVPLAQNICNVRKEKMNRQI